MAEHHHQNHRGSVPQTDLALAEEACDRGWLSRLEVDRLLNALVERQAKGYPATFLSLAVQEERLTETQVNLLDLGRAAGADREADGNDDDESGSSAYVAPTGTTTTTTDSSGRISVFGIEAPVLGSAVRCPRCGESVDLDPEGGAAALTTCRACGYVLDLAEILGPKAGESTITTIGSTTEMTKDPWIGWTVGRVKLTRKLGQGGMGVVYLGVHETIDQLRAVKILPPSFARDETMADRFLYEARLMAKLEHRNIVQVYDVGREERGPGDASELDLPKESLARAQMKGGFFYLVMQFVDGGALSRALKKKGRFKAPFVLRIMEQVLEGLSFAHGKGIVHRDVKPDNIMVMANGTVKVADFGLAKTTGFGVDLTQAGRVIGSPAYMAPEQCDGRPVDARSDLYALGVSMYQMLTGQRPFTGPTPLAVMLMHQTETPHPPSELIPDIPDDVEAITLKLLKKVPTDRYQSGAEALRAVRSALHRHEESRSIRIRSKGPGGVSTAAAKQPRMVEERVLSDTELATARDALSEARNRILSMARQTPDPRTLLVALVDLQHKYDGTQVAEEVWADAATLRRFVAKVLTERGQDKAQAGAAAEALKLFSQAAQVSPGFAQAHADASAVLLKQNKLRDALKALSTAIAIEDADANLYLRRGNILRKLRRLDAAEADYSRAIELDHRQARALTNRGGIHLTRRQYDLALADFDRALAVDPQSEEALLGRGKVFLKQGWIDGALAEFRRLVQTFPDHAKAHNALGEGLIAKGHVAEAKRALQQAVRLDSDLPDPFYSLAVVAAHDEDRERAYQLLKKALKRGFHKYRRIRKEPAFAILQDHKGFQTLIAGMR